jgi:hypothetical protein
MAIPAVSPVALRYLAQFGLGCVALTRDRRLISTKNPAGHEAAWWTEAHNIGCLLRATKNGDVARAAQKLGVVVTDHEIVLARAEAATTKIQAGMQRAQQAGVLAEFNQEYKTRRLQAFRHGRNFISYKEARNRLQQALAGVAATGIAPEALMKTVFEVEGG